MAFGKSAEEKAAERTAEEQAAEQRRAAQAKAQADAALQASPVGQATAAFEQNQGFFEIQLLVGSSQRQATMLGVNDTPGTRTQTHAGTLSAIEAIGWKLEHVGYIFMITGENSRNNFMVTGQQTAVNGQTVGIYLFRRAG